MSKPVHPLEQKRNTGFQWTDAIVAYCYSTDYSSCVLEESKQRYFDDLTYTEKDCLQFETFLGMFGIKKAKKG